jgi:hypothetical protein
VVRAHPTVPAALTKPTCLPTHRDTCAVACRPPVLANPHPFTHNSAKLCAGGIDDDFSSRGFSVWIAAGRSAVGFDLARRRPGLYARTGAGLYRRRVPALQFRDPRYQPSDRLHGRQKVPALAGLPGAFQAGSRAERGRCQAGRPADGHPARNAAQGRERQAAQGQKAGETRDLTARAT